MVNDVEVKGGGPLNETGTAIVKYEYFVHSDAIPALLMMECGHYATCLKDQLDGSYLVWCGKCRGETNDS